MSDVDELEVGGRRLVVERARLADVPAIVALLADDELGAAREQAPTADYERAFAEVDADPRQHLVVVRGDADDVAATMQLTLIPGLSRGGATRMQVEAVRVARPYRGSGLGTALLRWAEDFGRRNGATMSQLTSDRSRVDAHRFYEALGYRPSHVGFKLPL